MALSGPDGIKVSAEAAKYALMAALDEVAIFRFVDALEYFSIAELCTGSDATFLGHLHQNVQKTIELIKTLEPEKTNNLYMFVKNAQNIVFSRLSRRLGRLIYPDEEMAWKGSLDHSVSSALSESLGSESSYTNLEDFFELNAKIESKLRDNTTDNKNCFRDTRDAKKISGGSFDPIVGCCSVS